MYTLIVRCTFDAAHRLPTYPGKCARVHGHTYRVEVEVASETLDAAGMVTDFVELRRRIEAVIPDHADLNEVMDLIPTAENIAAWLFERLCTEGIPVSAVTVWETDHYGCRYSPS